VRKAPITSKGLSHKKRPTTEKPPSLGPAVCVKIEYKV
jgi:hypothetical protein